MKRPDLALLLLVLLAFLQACSDMTDQPSFKSQEAPRLAPPPNSIPVQGLETFDATQTIPNPEPATAPSLQQGRELFAVNCAMCHGDEAGGNGPVGRRMNPPPPNLHDQRIQGLTDFDVYSRLTLGYGRMPAFKNRLTPTERWHLVNFVNSLNAVNSAP